MKNKKLLELEEKEKEALLEEMKSNDPSTDRYSRALENYTKLNSLSRERENDKNHRIDKNIHAAVEHVINIAGVVIPVCVYATICNNGFIIEKDGVIRSNILESMIKDFPKLFKFKR